MSTLKTKILLVLAMLLGLGLSGQSPETAPQQWRHMLSLRPITFANQQFNLAYTFRFHPRHALGLEAMYLPDKSIYFSRFQDIGFWSPESKGDGLEVALAYQHFPVLRTPGNSNLYFNIRLNGRVGSKEDVFRSYSYYDQNGVYQVEVTRANQDQFAIGSETGMGYHILIGRFNMGLYLGYQVGMELTQLSEDSQGTPLPNWLDDREWNLFTGMRATFSMGINWGNTTRSD